MTFTLNEIALLVIALLAGLVLGLIVSGRGKYKRYWRDEQLAHSEAVRDRESRLTAAQQRISELERQSHAITPDTATATATAGAVHGRDDLCRIHGITPQDEIALNEAGYHRYGQIAAIGSDKEAALETRLGLKPGVITHEKWREQARLLDARKDDEHAQLYRQRATRV